MNREYLAEFDERAGYLNFVSVGPPSRSVRVAATDLLDQVALGDQSAAQIIGPAYQAARGKIAESLAVAIDGGPASSP